jgi:hypothetical protein
MTKRLLAAAALALAACAPDFDPASQVDGLRVLAVRAEPPEIAPAPAGGGEPVAPDRAALTALVVRPDFAAAPARRTTILYLACTPAPGDPTPSPCVLLASLRDPTAALAEAAAASCAAPPPGDAPPPAVFAGAEVCDGSGAPCGPAVLPGDVALPSPEVALPSGYAFPPGAAERILGVEAAVLAFAVDATPAELGAGLDPACPAASVAQNLASLWAEREHVLSVKRLQIRGPEAPDAPNRNPVLAGILAGGAPLPEGAAVAPGALALAPLLPDDVASHVQVYTELDTTGAPLEARAEEWVTSWFSTAGELEELHTRGAEVEEWRVGPAGAALVAAVVRDLRGGVAWQVRRVTVE